MGKYRELGWVINTMTYGQNGCSVLEADAIAPYFMRSHFDLPRTDVDIAKAPTVCKLGFMLGNLGC